MSEDVFYSTLKEVFFEFHNSPFYVPFLVFLSISISISLLRFVFRVFHYFEFHSCSNECKKELVQDIEESE